MMQLKALKKEGVEISDNLKGINKVLEKPKPVKKVAKKAPKIKKLI